MPDNEDLYSYIHCKPAKNAKHRAQGEKKSVFCIPIVFHRDPGSGSSLKSEYGADIYPDPASDSGFIVIHFEDFIYLPNE